MGIDKVKHHDYHYTGIYRGTVTYNDDPDVKGKVKIFVHGVYPDEYEAKPEYLPWAEPAMGLFGGNWTNEKPDSHGNHLNSQVGWCTVPHAGLKPDMGSEVYLFFEHGDINFPIYFAAVQAGDGWFSEHPNQHVFRSDNVHIRIDENTTDKRSTCKFDSYNQKNSLLSIQDGTKKQTQTRIDIQVQANQMVAINLQISGDVNMRQIGDMYIEQQGNRHQTLIGNRYVKHVGNTYIEHDGIYISRQTGAYNQQYIEAQKIMDIVGNVTNKTYGNEYKEVQGDFTTKVGYTYTLFTGRNCDITVTQDMITRVLKNYILSVAQSADIDITQNCAVDIGRWNETQTGTLQLTTSNDIQVVSKQGGINLQTLGQFEMLNDLGALTSEGYKNLGLKGNITLKSNMGNIAIETVGNEDFEKENMVIPWNPVFLGNVQLISMIISDFDPTKILFNNNILNIGDIGSLMQFIMSLPMTAIYDGLPSFFPVKMIAQNPNHDPVELETWKYGKSVEQAKNFIQDHNIDKINDILKTQYHNISQISPKNIEKLIKELTTPEYKHYRDVEDNWKNVTNDAYWKVLGRIIGNIDVRSWSGDINIVTEGRLGNAGNINISANDSIGALPGYKTGNVNISNKAKRTVYTDPRDLFLDSQNILNRINILSNGTDKKEGKLLRYINVQNQSGTAGGCASCIADYLLQLLSPIAPLPKDLIPLYALNIPLHPFNATIQPNDFIWDDPKPVKILKMGLCHALDKGYEDEFCKNGHGNITVSSNNNLYISSQGKYSLNTNLMYGNDKYSFDVTVTPNWKYGDIIKDLRTYMPTGRQGVNLGNVLTLNEKFGSKYNINYSHQKIDKLVYCIPSSISITTNNVSTDANILKYNLSIGNKNTSFNQSWNDNWSLLPLPYLDPHSSIKDPISTPTVSPSPAYTSNYNTVEEYININENFKQSITVSPVSPSTTLNVYSHQTSPYNIINEQEMQIGGATINHTLNKDIGCPLISEITTNTKGMNITESDQASMNLSRTSKGMMISQNFEATLTDQETHKALIMTSQSYESLAYNLDVKAANEKQNYIGIRSITSDEVTWAVTHLNFTQKGG